MLNELNAPFTWASLGTVAGCAAFTLLLVQAVKAPLDRLFHMPTRLLVYLVCLSVMLASAAFEGGLTLETGLLAAVNALIPTASAFGAYELTFATEDRAGEEARHGRQ